MPEKYHKSDDLEAFRVFGGRTVVTWDDDHAGHVGVVFRCPCDERQVYVASPPHTIKFDAEGVVDIKASCGYRKRDNPPRPANWCHFWINDGVPEMCGDAKCPGGSGEVA